jgi:hypothetical protein
MRLIDGGRYGGYPLISGIIPFLSVMTVMIYTEVGMFFLQDYFFFVFLFSFFFFSMHDTALASVSCGALGRGARDVCIANLGVVYGYIIKRGIPSRVFLGLGLGGWDCI